MPNDRSEVRRGSNGSLILEGSTSRSHNGSRARTRDQRGHRSSAARSSNRRSSERRRSRRSPSQPRSRSRSVVTSVHRERKQGSNGSLVFGGSTRPHARAPNRQGHCSSAARSSNRRSSERRRSRRSPSQPRSRSRSVVTPPVQKGLTLQVPLDTQKHETTDRSSDRSRSKQNCRDMERRRLQTPRRESSVRSRSLIRSSVNRTARSVTPQLASGVTTELLKCIKESLETISTVNTQTKEKFTNNNVVPEFDPKAKNQTILTWLNKVKECSEIYNWDSKQTAHYALPKLAGTAKKWYEGQPSVLHTWDEWVGKLKTAFPTYENYGHLLTEMLAKRAKFGDNLEDYYYEKLIALNRCGITGKNAIDCIVYGIDDRSVRYGAEAVGFEDADKLLGYLRGIKHERIDKDNLNKKQIRSVNDVLRKPVRNDLNRVVKCFNCHEMGHVVTGCKKPIIRCQKCKRIGHDNPNCSRDVWVEKAEVKTL